MNAKLIKVQLTFALLAVLAGVSLADAQRIETGFLDRSLKLDGSEYLYQVYVPREFSRAKKWPVILALHGGGEYGNDGIRQTWFGVATAIRKNRDRVPAIVVFPQARADGKPGWQLDGGRAAMMALDHAIKEFDGDADRVVLAGLSAGGNGSWYLAAKHPDKFAGLVVICGWVTELTGKQTKILYPSLASPGAADAYADVAKRVASIPVWIFHGENDPTISVEESRRMYAALKALGADVQYTEFPDVGHDAWNPAFERADLFEWVLKRDAARAVSASASNPRGRPASVRPSRGFFRRLDCPGRRICRCSWRSSPRGG